MEDPRCPKPRTPKPPHQRPILSDHPASPGAAHLARKLLSSPASPPRESHQAPLLP
ncbi:hypothetical protein [Deinococcus wulumuqiensis]|uniref:hypothetical protein n=1 Tax=Deinococcus wulumuqiensis TaxID=980427 RepID=UPI0013C2C8CD|nr:hypothetical protein [Deinococcus wulumuqiensis]